MRLAALILSTCLPLMPAIAQDAPPLPPYTPPPSSAPLAPLPGDAASPPADEQNLGEVRASSTTAANISSADTRSIIAPKLPAPDASGDSLSAYLAAARSALQADQTGAAQEALERAESRALDRSVVPSRAGDPSQNPLVERIGAARKALSVGNGAAALQAIGDATHMLAASGADAPPVTREMAPPQ